MIKLGVHSALSLPLILPGQVDPQMESAILESYPGAGEKTIQLSAENWQIITDGMAAVTATGTAAPAHLEGIDFAGKTGTAQVMSHAGLAKAAKGRNTTPNAWFVGMVPRRNPDIVVAVLWEHGNWGNNSAKLASQIIDAFVTKQRSQNHNLKLADEPAPRPAEPPSTPIISDATRHESAPHTAPKS